MKFTYKNLLEMIKAFGLEQEAIYLDFEYYQHHSRFFLDDYPEQKRLRKEYLQNNYLIVLSLTENGYRKKKLKEF